jgi:hypothetical protein
MMTWLSKHLKFVKTSEEFNRSYEGGIWVSAEHGDTYGGVEIFDYYAEGSSYEFGVYTKFNDMVQKYGWYCEWYDSGTMMIWVD